MRYDSIGSSIATQSTMTNGSSSSDQHTYANVGISPSLDLPFSEQQIPDKVCDLYDTSNVSGFIQNTQDYSTFAHETAEPHVPFSEQQIPDNVYGLYDTSNISKFIQNVQDLSTFAHEAAEPHDQHALQLHYNLSVNQERDQRHSSANVNQSSIPIEAGLIGGIIVRSHQSVPIGMIQFSP
jgi:hypothetical protein